MLLFADIEKGDICILSEVEIQSVIIGTALSMITEFIRSY